MTPQLRHPDLPGWVGAPFAAGGYAFDVYRKGAGPGVIVIPEVPGPTRTVISFAEEVVDSGFTVSLTHLFGEIGTEFSAVRAGRMLARLCLRAEFTALATNVTAPLAPWLRALSAQLHDECGGPGVGVVGMCFTGGFALAAMVDPSVVAPVLSQPSVPLPFGPRRARDINLSPEDLVAVQDRVAAGCPILGLRFEDDPAVGHRFDTYREAFGSGFRPVEFPGRKHSVLTTDRQERGVQAVLDFLHERLDG